MVRKIISVFCGLMICLLIPLVVFLNEKKQYLYPVASDFNFMKWLFVCCTVLVFEASVYFAIKFLKKKKLITILLALTLIPQIIFVSFCFGVFSGTNWRSKTLCIDNYGTIDPYFDSQFEFCDLKMSEIMAKETVSVNRYEYNYQLELAAISFDVYFEVELTEEKYIYLKTVFQENLKLENTEESDVKEGKFILSEQTETNVDEWDEMYIEYNDLTCTFHMKFQGVCYT